MNLGRRCKYAGECPVYQNEIKTLGKPIYLIRNVFCNRGHKGWNNCKRYLALEQGQPVEEEMTPYG